MLRLVVLSMCLGLCLGLGTYTGTYNTISSTLRGYFSNTYSTYKSTWTTSTTYTSSGMPTYDVPCSGTPNTATVQTNTLTITATKEVSSGTSYCMPMGPIGWAVNGVAIFNAASADDEDAYTAEGSTFDGCGAHSQTNGIYHYHIVPGSTCPSTAGSNVCFTWNQVTEFTSTVGTTYLVGVALDGFPIMVTTKDGKVVTEIDLDVCGGKAYTYSGSTYYAYFIQPTFPYTLGCFKGTISASSSATQSQLTTCAGMGANYICYCKATTTATVKNCLPAKGATTCTAGQAVDCNISGTCLNSLPSGGATQRVSYVTMALLALGSLIKLSY